MRKKFLSLALALTMVTSLVPTASVEAAKVKKPYLSQSKLSLEVGAKKTLKLKRAPKLSKKKIKKVKWSSSNSKVVRVSVKGKKRDKAVVTALARGSATVKVRYNGKTCKCKVTVTETSSTRRDTEVVTEQLTEQPKTTEQEKTTEKPSGENTKPSEEKPTQHVHNYSDWKTVVAATCVKEGSEKRECSCGDKETRTIKALGHQWDEGKITKVPTLESTGVKVYTCSVCKKQTKEYLPQLISDNIITVTKVNTKEARRYKNVVGETPSQAGFYVNMAFEGVIVDYGDATARVFYVFNGGQPFLYRETGSVKGIVAPMFGNSNYLDIIAKSDFGGVVTEKVESAPDMAAFYSLSDVRTLIDRMISDGRLEDRSYELRPAECYWMRDDTE